METTPRTLGPAEARVVLSFREQGRDVVEADDIISLLASEKLLLRLGATERKNGPAIGQST